MKKILILLLLFLTIFLSGCDGGFICFITVISENSNLKILDNEQMLDIYEIDYGPLNNYPFGNYSSIDFTNTDQYSQHAYVFTIKLINLDYDNNNYMLSMNLKDPRKYNDYMLDFSRIALVVDEQLTVYKFFEKNEVIYHKENDPDTILHFNNMNEVCNNYEIKINSNETKEIILFVWLEQSEQYDKDGKFSKRINNRFFNAGPMQLDITIK